MGAVGSGCGSRAPTPDVEESSSVNFGSEQHDPDYSQPANWHCCFKTDQGNNVAAWVPKQYNPAPGKDRPLESKQDTSTCDVFYVHGTTALRGLGNASLDERPGVEGFPDASEDVRLKASAFNACAAVYAPKYRQARLSNLHMMEGSMLEEPFGPLPSYLEDLHKCPVGNAAFEVAYHDVRKAFMYYLRELRPSGRPFILAGHGQGAQHLTSLIHELEATEPSLLQKELVAAYLVGWQLGEDSFKLIKVGTTKRQLGCFVSFTSVSNPPAGSKSASGGMGRGVVQTIAGGRKRPGYASCTHHTRMPVSVNPLTWETLSKASTEAHLGCLHPHSGTLYPKCIGAVCTEAGSVLILPEDVCGNGDGGGNGSGAKGAAQRGGGGDGGGGDDGEETVIFSPTKDLLSNGHGDFHLSDFHLFWANIRRNAEERVAAWHAKKRKRPGSVDDTPAGVPLI
eukprot:g951.t1